MSVSAGIVGIATGLVAVAAGDTKEVLPSDGAKWVVISVALFAAATLLALVIHFPVDLNTADDEALTGFVQENWYEDDWDRSVAEQQLEYLATLHNANKRFGWLMFASLAAQLLAVGSTGYLAVLIVQNVT